MANITRTTTPKETAAIMPTETRKTEDAGANVPDPIMRDRLIWFMNLAGATVEDMAAAIGNTPRMFMRKACGQSHFTVSEITIIMNHLDLKEAFLNAVFFHDYVENQNHSVTRQAHSFDRTERGKMDMRPITKEDLEMWPVRFIKEFANDLGITLTTRGKENIIAELFAKANRSRQ